MQPFVNTEVAAVFNDYPKHVREKMMFLRQLVLDTANESKDMLPILETLKWSEPSYLCKIGSIIRMDWKSAHPKQIALYFHCKTSLIDTFKELYGNKLKFEGNRAILFDISEAIPTEEVKHCIFLSLTYHNRKHLPLLGV